MDKVERTPVLGESYEDYIERLKREREEEFRQEVSRQVRGWEVWIVLVLSIVLALLALAMLFRW